MQPWASLGGYGRVNATLPMPVGNPGQGGPLGLVLQALMRKGAMGGRPPLPEEEQDPQADLELARLLGLAPQQRPLRQWASLGMRGY